LAYILLETLKVEKFLLQRPVIGTILSPCIAIIIVVERVHMALSAAEKAEVVKSFGRTVNDTGSSEVQIALLTKRILGLTEHLKINKNDTHTRYGLGKLVSQRRRLMRYLKTDNLELYQKVIKELELRG